MINIKNKYTLAALSATSVIYALGASNIHADSRVGEVTAYALNVRSGPSISSNAIGSLKKGDKVEILSSKDGWYNIKYGSKTGWVSGDYVSTNSDSSSSCKIVVATAGLNVRSGPSTSNSIIGGLRKGDKVEVLSSKDGWYNIKYGSKTGWISGDYVSTNGDSSDNSSSNGKILVATTGLNVRTGGSTKYKKIGYIKKNQSVEVIGTASSGWYKVKLSDGTIGYSSNKYLKESNSNPSIPPSSPPSNVPNNPPSNDDITVIDNLIATANLNVRSGPSTSNSIVGVVYKYDNVSIVERTNNNWYKIKLSSGKIGYCSATYLKSQSELDSVTNKPESSDDISYSMQVKSYAYYTGTITATGTKPTFGRTIAVDPTIIPYGTRIYIPEFDKTFIAEDCGGGIKGNKIDIYMNTEQECINWGVRNITIYILK